MKVGRQVTLQILYMAAPHNESNLIERRRWSQMLALIALKKTAGWETETGLCAVETLAMTWCKHRDVSKPETDATLPWTFAVFSPPGKTLTYQSDFDTNGVLYYIGTCGGTRAYQNPHVAGHVAVTWSSVGGGPVEGFVQNRRNHLNAYTINQANSWMQVDLRDWKVRPTRYSLRHGHNGDGHALRNWRLEGSINGTDWTTLRNHVNDPSIPAVIRGTATWSVDNCTRYYRYIRIFHSGLNSNRNHYLMCSGIELYGDLRKNK